MSTRSEQIGLFGSSDTDSNRNVIPKEPLYSMLMTCDVAAIRYLYSDLTNFDDEERLNDLYDNVGLSRKEFIEQVMLVMRNRGLIS